MTLSIVLKVDNSKIMTTRIVFEDSDRPRGGVNRVIVKINLKLK